MKKTVIIILGIIFFFAGVTVTTYFFVKREISDEAIKSRLLSALKDFGTATVGHAQMDILEGIVLDDVSFVGASEDLLGKSLHISKIVIKHNPQGLIKGKISISGVTVISPELIVEKPTDVWSLLDSIKKYFDESEIPLYMDDLRNGIEIRDMKIHIMEDPQTNSPEIKVSGIDVIFLPYAGSLKDVVVRGTIEDPVLGNYSFTMRLYPVIPRLEIEVCTKNLEINEDILAQFPYVGKMLWNDYKPAGKFSASCVVSLDNQNNQKKMDYAVDVNLNGLEAMYTGWPFRIHDLSGCVKLNTEKIYLKDIVGYIKDEKSFSQVKFNGEFDVVGNKKTLVITIPNLFVNEALLHKIPEVGEQVYSKIRPSGFVDMTFQYNEGEKEESSYYLTVNCKDMEITSPDFPLPMSHVNGQFRLCNDIIILKNTSGFIRCGDQLIYTEINGVYDITHERKIFNVTVPNLVITETLLKNIPKKEFGEMLWTELHPKGRVDIVANLQGFKEEKDNNYFVEINLKDCEIANDKHTLSFWGIGGRIEINKEGVVCKHIDAKYCGGHVEGAVSVKTQINPFQYEGNLNFSRVILEELTDKVAGEDKQWSGILDGRVKFRGSGKDTKHFNAEGQLKVSDGYLSEVPIVLSVFNFLNLGLPKKESFHSAMMNFVVKDGLVHIEEGRIYSDSIELNGRGNISLKGELDLTVVAGFNKDFFSKLPIVGRVFDFVVGGVRKQLTMVEIKGTFLKPESRSVPFRPFTRSIKSMFDLLPEQKQNTHTDTNNASQE